MCNSTADAKASPPLPNSGGGESPPRPTLRDIFRQFGPAYRANVRSSNEPRATARDDDGEQWLPSRVNFLAPVPAASELSREKFRELLRQHGLLDQAPAKAFARK